MKKLKIIIIILVIFISVTVYASKLSSNIIFTPKVENTIVNNVSDALDELKEIYIKENKERIYLYNLGDQQISVTGGWKLYNPGFCSLSYNSNNLVYVGGNSNSTSNLYTVNNIDVSGYNYIYIETSTSPKSLSFGLSTNATAARLDQANYGYTIYRQNLPMEITQIENGHYLSKHYIPDELKGSYQVVYNMYVDTLTIYAIYLEQ